MLYFVFLQRVTNTAAAKTVLIFEIYLCVKIIVIIVLSSSAVEALACAAAGSACEGSLVTTVSCLVTPADSVPLALVSLDYLAFFDGRLVGVNP